MNSNTEVCSDSSKFDPRAVLRLRKWGGEQLVREMAELFASDTPRRIAVARDAAAQRDWLAVERAAHALKSSCAQMGAVRMSDICAEVEVVAAGESPTRAVSLVDALSSEFASFAMWLDDVITTYRTQNYE